MGFRIQCIFTTPKTVQKASLARKRAPPKSSTMPRIAETSGSERPPTSPSPSPAGRPSKRLPIQKQISKKASPATPATPATPTLRISRSRRIISNTYKNQMTTNTYTPAAVPEEGSGRFDSTVKDLAGLNIRHD